MDIGFETIGNAVLVCHDRGPVLVADPWLTGGAYFGSWGLSDAIPEGAMGAIKECSYFLVSQGRPDQMSLPSLELLGDKQILIPDHVGGLIREGLTSRGLKVTVLR